MQPICNHADPEKVGAPLVDTTKVYFDNDETKEKAAFVENLPISGLPYDQGRFPYELVLFGIVKRAEIRKVIRGELVKPNLSIEPNNTTSSKSMSPTDSGRVKPKEDYL